MSIANWQTNISKTLTEQEKEARKRKRSSLKMDQITPDAVNKYRKKNPPHPHSYKQLASGFNFWSLICSKLSSILSSSNAPIMLRCLSFPVLFFFRTGTRMLLPSSRASNGIHHLPQLSTQKQRQPGILAYYAENSTSTHPLTGNKGL